MNNIFSFRRIANLLRYDWAMEKRRFVMPFAIFAFAYILCTFSTFYPGYSSGHLSDDSLPILVLIFANSFVSYAELAMILIVTAILHRKFTQPQSSCLYLTLPASPLEKFTVMLLDYVIAFTALYIVYTVLFYLTMLSGYLLEPSYDWSLAPFNSSSSFIKEIIETLQTRQAGMMDGESGYEQRSATDVFLNHIYSHYTSLIVFSFFANLCAFFYYLILNMCFKHNAQIKSIGLFLLTGFIAIVAFCIGFGIYISTKDFSGMDETGFIRIMTRSFDLLYYALLACVPLSFIEGYIFYRQIRYKQAK